MTIRCIGGDLPRGGRCRKYNNRGEAGWDFLKLGTIEGWICPDCRGRLHEATRQGLPSALSALPPEDDLRKLVPKVLGARKRTPRRRRV